jgi:hypothetical protein
MTRVSLAIQSHLSDIMVLMSWNTDLAQERLRFVKYLVHMFPDTTTIIDDNIVYQQFKLGDE